MQRETSNYLKIKEQEEETMKVKEVMTRNVITCIPEETVKDIAARMGKHDLGMLVVVEDNYSKILQGVVTDRDILRRVIGKDLDARRARVEDIMTKKIVSVFPNDSLTDAVRLMKVNGVKRLVVTDEANQLIGIISNSDIVKEFMEIRKKMVDLTIGF